MCNNKQCECQTPSGIYFDIFKQRVSKEEFDNETRSDIEYPPHYSTEVCGDCGGIVYLAIF